jgi:hypothetical protein
VGREGSVGAAGRGRGAGLGNVFAKYARQHLFRELDDVATRDGSNLEVVDAAGNALFAPLFSTVSVARSSINPHPNAPLQWTVVEECLNPPMVWEASKGWYTKPSFITKIRQVFII